VGQKKVKTDLWDLSFNSQERRQKERGGKRHVIRSNHTRKLGDGRRCPFPSVRGTKPPARGSWRFQQKAGGCADARGCKKKKRGLLPAVIPNKGARGGKKKGQKKKRVLVNWEGLKKSVLVNSGE